MISIIIPIINTNDDAWLQWEGFLEINRFDFCACRDFPDIECETVLPLFTICVTSVCVCLVARIFACC